MKAATPFLAATSAALACVSGFILWRQDLTEAKLLEEGHRSALKSVYWHSATPAMEASLIKRERDPRGGWIMTYELRIDRTPEAMVVDKYGIPLPESHAKGTLVLHPKMSVRASSGSLWGGVQRPQWTSTRADTSGQITYEMLWERIDEEPANASFDADHVRPMVPYGASIVIRIAGSRRLSSWSDTSFVLGNDLFWKWENGWDQQWSKRLDTEIKAIQDALKTGAIPQAQRAEVASSLKHFLTGAGTSDFRGKWRAELAKPSN